MKRIVDCLSILLFGFFATDEVFSQPVNNTCQEAIAISDPENYCSGPGAFSLEGATYGAPQRPNCHPNSSNDVWFSFTAVATDLSVRVSGNSGIIRVGSIEFPELVVYRGGCSGLMQIACLSNAFGTGVVELFVLDLEPGETYHIRVSSRSDEPATFQLCVNNFFNVANPSGDCITGVVLCDKSPFSVPILTGVGNDPSEADGLCIGGEFASAWYKWTCDRPGSLYFTLTPNNPSDDLDFALFELPDGIDNCENKRLLRCMASGENLGEPVENWIRCYGPTGLRPGATGVQENPGCQPGDDNFLAPIQMTAGRSYALIVNNFSQTGSGFSVEFGGSGTFLGPLADFAIAEPEVFCRGDSILVIDQSQANDGSTIESFSWNFGEDSQNRIRTSDGPHWVFYDSPGFKTISLTISNERGCIATRRRNILIECCDYPVFADAGASLDVELGEDIQLNVIADLPGENYSYLWSPASLLDCPECRSPFATLIESQFLQVIVTDEEGCVAIDSVFVNVLKNKPVFAPNAFTPNGDAINDKFTVFTNQAARSVKLMRIYNRWGDLMYEAQDFPPNDTNFGWDGTFRGQKLDPGVYVYYVEVEFIDEDVTRLAGEINLFN